ncbi:MAG: hypothetical protein ACLQGP_13310 [Isosphaeraceae bacterium]
MSRPTPSDRSLDEEIRGWIAEAGDCRVEARAEHIDRTRHLLLERVVLPPEVVIRPDEPESAPLGVGLIRLSALTALIAAALFVAVYLSRRPADGWAAIAQTLHDQQWVHIIATGLDGLNEESWISPRYQILARRHLRGEEVADADFEDIDGGFKDTYIAEEKTIFRDAYNRGRPQRPAQELEVFAQLLNAEQFKLSPIPDTEIVSESHRNVGGPAKIWEQYELTLRWISVKKPDVKLSIVVDRKTGLPRTWMIASDDGTLYLICDYPATGPADVRALGVPASAKRDSPLPEEGLDQLLTGLRIGRTRFDDYCAYVWDESAVPANLQRVWRKGRKWRVEHVIPRSTTREAILDHDRIPIEIDLAGMKQKEEDLIFEPQAICDGLNLWLYKYKPNKSIVPDRPYVSERESVTHQQIYGIADDLGMPWPELMPELIGHPNADSLVRFWAYFLDPSPSDGPPGTVRLQVRESRFQDAKLPDRYRLWIDPNKNHLAMRSEIGVFEPPPPRNWNGRALKPAYIDTRILTDVARSPNGFWYPTRVLRKASNSKADQVMRFLLDFQVAIPDELFEPIE